MQQVTPDLARSFGLERARGALVADVPPNSPAESAGIQRDDVIIAFNGRELEDMHELPRILAHMSPGNVAEVRLLRSGKEQMVQVKVGEMLEEQRQAVVGGTTPGGEWGLAVQDLTPEVARSLGLSDTRGVIVNDVEESSPADEVGMRRGDVILEVNQQKITNLQNCRARLGRAGEAKSLLFLVRRGDNTVYVALRLEG